MKGYIIHLNGYAFIEEINIKHIDDNYAVTDSDRIILRSSNASKVETYEMLAVAIALHELNGRISEGESLAENAKENIVAILNRNDLSDCSDCS